MDGIKLCKLILHNIGTSMAFEFDLLVKKIILGIQRIITSFITVFINSELLFALYLHFIIIGIPYTLYNVHCTVYTIYTVQCTVYNLQCILYNVQCTMYILQYTIYNVQYTTYNVKYTMYNV